MGKRLTQVMGACRGKRRGGRSNAVPLIVSVPILGWGRRALPLLLLVLFLLCPTAYAQYGNTVTIPTAGAPTGTCNFNQWANDRTNGRVYYCNNVGQWQIVAGGSITAGTIGFIPVYTAATTLGNSRLDDGITTVNTLTYSGAGGIATNGTSGLVHVTCSATTPVAAGDIRCVTGAPARFHGYGAADQTILTSPLDLYGSTPAALLVTKAAGADPTTNNCAKWVAGGGLGDAGAVCGGLSIATAGQGGFWGVTEDFPSTSVASSAATANRVQIYQFVLHAQHKVTNIVFTVSTLHAGGLVDFGIYDAALTTLLLHTGAQSTGAAGQFSVAIASVTLGPGVFYFAWGTDDTTAIFAAINTQQDSFSLMLNTNTSHVGYCANALSGGALPATCGAVTAGGVNEPAVWFEP